MSESAQIVCFGLCVMSIVFEAFGTTLIFTPVLICPPHNSKTTRVNPCNLQEGMI